ncbi:hypothetical protein [Sorangium sp. So ce362]|uniref:hypothetical protein n=1 Tax=Sorangium sp. So ce362 TaxID=3133303 RepID=UPI003F60B173
MVTEVLAGLALLRVYVQVEGVSYSAGMTVDGEIELARGGDVVDTGRFNGKHIVGISGEVTLPQRAYLALEEGLQGAAALVQYLATPATPATRELAP